MIRLAGQLMLVLALAAGVPGAARAQMSVTTADVQRLQDNIYDASREIAQIRGRDSTLESQLRLDLEEVFHTRNGGIPVSLMKGVAS